MKKYRLLGTISLLSLLQANRITLQNFIVLGNKTRSFEKSIKQIQKVLKERGVEIETT